jgi:hypothetical protein
MLSFARKCFLSAALKIFSEEQSFKFLSKLFQIWTALYVNDRWILTMKVLLTVNVMLGILGVDLIVTVK